jgi:hypothetical protein
MDHITGPTIVRLMRLHKQSIRSLAAAMNITQKRVRQVRVQGVQGVAYAQDWMQAITSNRNDGFGEVARACLLRSSFAD